MVPKHSYQNTKIHFILPSIDSEEHALLELLENDLEDFFFGVKIVIETEEDNKKVQKAPLRTIKHSFVAEKKNE